MSSEAHRSFAAEPMSEKPITKLAGVDETLGQQLKLFGFDKVFLRVSLSYAFAFLLLKSLRLYSQLQHHEKKRFAWITSTISTDHTCRLQLYWDSFSFWKKILNYSKIGCQTFAMQMQNNWTTVLNVWVIGVKNSCEQAVLHWWMGWMDFLSILEMLILDPNETMNNLKI